MKRKSLFEDLLISALYAQFSNVYQFDLGGTDQNGTKRIGTDRNGSELIGTDWNGLELIGTDRNRSEQNQTDPNGS